MTFLNARSLEVTLLTGLRTGEVIGARWTEIDLKRKTLVIPPERLKDRNTRTEPHRVPLSPQVVAILKTLPRLGEFVFPGLKPGKPLSNMAMLSVLKDMNCHDWRASLDRSQEQSPNHSTRTASNI